jgi:hypothetical protein
LEKLRLSSQGPAPDLWISRFPWGFGGEACRSELSSQRLLCVSGFPSCLIHTEQSRPLTQSWVLRSLCVPWPLPFRLLLKAGCTSQGPGLLDSLIIQSMSQPLPEFCSTYLPLWSVHRAGVLACSHYIRSLLVLIDALLSLPLRPLNN